MNPLSKAARIYRNNGLSELLYRTYHHLLSPVQTYLINTILFYLLYVLATIIGRDEERLVFANVARYDFSDNTKYLYLHANNNCDESVRPIWISEDPETVRTLSEHGFEAYISGSLQARYHMFRSQYIFFDNRMTYYKWIYTSGATRYQLRHGIPVKSPPAKDTSLLQIFLWKITRQYDFVVTNSDKDLSHCNKHSQLSDYGVGCIRPAIESGKPLESGFPRTDIFFKEIPGATIGVSEETKEVFDKIEDFDSVIGYFPTMRHQTDSIRPFDEKAFDRYLEENNAALLLKPHRGMSIEYRSSPGERIFHLPSYGDLYPYLDQIDVLITDYSSIAFDFSITEGSIIMYPFDRDDYVETRGLHPDYDTIVNRDGVTTDQNELFDILDICLSQDQTIPHQFSSYFRHRDGDSARRILDSL